MIDAAMARRAEQGRPIQVALIGAGATGRAVALQLGTPVPGLRLAGISNRTAKHAERAFREAGVSRWTVAQTPGEATDAIRRGVPVLCDDPDPLLDSPEIDVIVEVTGTIDFAAGVVLEALARRKPVVLVNAELDSTIGPILRLKAEQAGVGITHTDGDEPGVAMTLLRYLRSLGLKPVAAGNIKGMVDHYRNPDTQRAFAAQHDQDVHKVTSFADATKLSMEATVLANATGFQVGRRGMYGPRCSEVGEMARLLPAEDMLSTGLVDYALGAAPHTGAFVIVHEGNPLKQTQLGYYKMGSGPFYVFHTPFHLPHLQIVSTIGRLVLFGDPTVCPLGGPRCEVVAMAKKDLHAGELLDGIGGFTTYGLIENRGTARATGALPIGLSEGCILRRGVAKDSALTSQDVEFPPERLSDRLWREQEDQWGPASRKPNSSPGEPVATR